MSRGRQPLRGRRPATSARSRDLALDEPVAGRALDEARVGEQRPVEADQRRDAFDRELVERAQHARRGRSRGRGPRRSASRSAGRRGPRPRSPRSTPESTRTPGPAGSRYAVIVPGDGRKPLRRVLGVDPALDRVARAARRPPGGTRAARRPRSRICSLHEVDAGDELGDRVLDLDPGVHLEEVVVRRPRRAGPRSSRR